jgi:hypothetical protein
MVYIKMCKPSKEHPAFLQTWSFENTPSHMASGIAHHEVLPHCLFHVRQVQRVSSSAASLVKRPGNPCSRVRDVTLARSIPSRHAHRGGSTAETASVLTSRTSSGGACRTGRPRSSSGAGRGSSPIAPCQHRCRCSSHTEQGGVVPSMTDQVLGTANLVCKAPIRRSVAPKTSGNDGEADRRSLHVERSEHTTRTRDDTRKRSREAPRPPQPGWK